MFQIAVAIGYARKYGYQWGVDPSNGHGEPYSSIHKVYPNLPKVNPSGHRHHEHPHGICQQHSTPYDYCHFGYHDIPDLGPNVVLTGFYQSWKYFEHCKEEVKEVFKVPHVSGYEDYVSIHVRRGDYVQHAGSFPPITVDFVTKAMIHLGLSKKYIVFSDDLNWCKENFNTDIIHIEFSEGKSELEDLSLMASCGHHIIANSSFSWWGAYLGSNPDKVVVSPSAETWFGPTAGVKKPVVDLILPGWIQIPTR